MTATDRQHFRVLAAACLVAACLGPPARAVPPAEITGLTWCAGSHRCLEWDVAPDAGSFTVYRGIAADLAGLVDATTDAAYVGRFVDTTTGETLLGVPPSGTFYWYLVTGTNADGESTAGYLALGEGPLAARTVDASGGSCGDIAYREGFDDVGDGDPWPDPWVPVGSVDVADVQSGAARFRPTVGFYSLARLHAPRPFGGDSDVEVTFTVEYEDIATQGVGFYVRQNGGYLNQTFPAGQGYAVFIEGFRSAPGIGLWKEIAGEEIALDIRFDPALALQDDTRYRVRFRVRQDGPARTRLEARIWPEGTLEPAEWQITFSDTTPELQGIAGGYAADSWSSINPSTPGMPTPAHTRIDGVQVVRLCPPAE